MLILVLSLDKTLEHYSQVSTVTSVPFHQSPFQAQILPNTVSETVNDMTLTALQNTSLKMKMSGILLTLLHQN